MNQRLWMAVLVVLTVLASGCGTQRPEGMQDTSTMETQATTEPSAAPDEIQTTTTPPDSVVEVKRSEKDYRELLNEKYSRCIECHGDVKPFHIVEIIYRLDREKGINPRLCLVCHGQKVHNIHLTLLNDKQITCDTCHTYSGEFTKPTPKKGQLLVCATCHSDGNYIKIHIEGTILENAPIDEKWITKREGHQCDTCHVGDIDTVHFDPLSEWRERVERATEEAREEPISVLNISYI